LSAVLLSTVIFASVRFSGNCMYTCVKDNTKRIGYPRYDRGRVRLPVHFDAIYVLFTRS